jgi:hypothetical protein
MDPNCTKIIKAAVETYCLYAIQNQNLFVQNLKAISKSALFELFVQKYQSETKSPNVFTENPLLFPLFNHKLQPVLQMNNGCDGELIQMVKNTRA